MRCLVLASWLGVGLAAVISSGPVGDERGTPDSALKEQVALAMERTDGLFSARWRLDNDCEQDDWRHQVNCWNRKVYTFTLEDPRELPRLAEILRDQGGLHPHPYDVRANVRAVEDFRSQIEASRPLTGTIGLVGPDGDEPLGTAETPISSVEIQISSRDYWEHVVSRVAEKLGADPETLSLVPTNSGGGPHWEPLGGPVQHSGVKHTKQVSVCSPSQEGTARQGLVPVAEAEPAIRAGGSPSCGEVARHDVAGPTGLEPGPRDARTIRQQSLRFSFRDVLRRKEHLVPRC